MRGPKEVAVAVRKADGSIDVDVNPVNSIAAVSYTHLSFRFW